jgi:hypothetical protein
MNGRRFLDPPYHRSARRANVVMPPCARVRRWAPDRRCASSSHAAAVLVDLIDSGTTEECVQTLEVGRPVLGAGEDRWVEGQ